MLAEHGRAPEQVRFTSEMVEQARALGAVHDAGWSALIAGQDIADTLVADWLAAARKDAEQHPPKPSRNGAVHAENAAEDVEQLREQGAQEREAQRRQREQAVTYNLRLGTLAFKHLTRLKVDERVIRILTAVDVGGSLRGLAARGARLSAPGWVTQAEQKNGRTKTSYLEPHECTERAREFLAAAKGAGEIAGRAITVIALAVHADEDALAQSSRSYHEVSFRGPWGKQAQQDLAELIAERIKPGELPALDQRLGRNPGETGD